jgi:hypothetical protein
MAILEASATLDDTIASATYTLLDSMTLIPGAGDYLVVFSTDVEHSDFDEYIRVCLFVNGVQQAHTEREFYAEASIINMSYPIAISAYISVGAGEAVEVKWLRTNAGTATAHKRTLNLFPVNSGDIDQQTATLDDTLDSATYTQLGSMNITPGAGDYLLMFTTSAQGPADTQLAFAVHVNGTIVQHTERTIDIEGSIPDTSLPVAIYCKVSPGAGEVVDIKWKRSAGTGTITCHERTLTLYKVTAGQLYEASGTADDTETSTSDTRLDDMILTPGAGDYLALFSESHRYGTIGVHIYTYFSLYVNAVQTGHTERSARHEDTIDNSNICAMTNGKVSPGISQDVEVKWRSSATDTRTGHERTLVLLKEAGAVVIGRMYSATFEEVSVTAAQDLFEINAPSNAIVILHALHIAQSSDIGFEQLNILIHRGTTSGSGGSSITARPLEAGGGSFNGSVEANNTTQSTEGTILHSQCFSIQGGCDWDFLPECRPVISPSGRLIIELQPAPADALPMRGTIYFEEIGG